MAMSPDTASLLRFIKADVEDIATGRIQGGSAVVVAGRIKDMVDELVVSAAKNEEAAER